MSDDTILEEEAVVETKKKSKKPTSISKTIGTNIMGTITELNTISNEEALYEYLERVSEGVPKEVLILFYESLNNKRGYQPPSVNNPSNNVFSPNMNTTLDQMKRRY